MKIKFDNYAGYFLLCSKWYIELLKEKEDYSTNDFSIHEGYKWFVSTCEHILKPLTEHMLKYI